MTTPPTLINQTSLEDLQRQVRESPDTLFAILDACGEPRVPERANALGQDRAVSLYRGWAEEDFWAVAPYLVRVDEATLAWIVETLWNDPWGIFAVASDDLAMLRKHFRRFLLFRGPEKKEFYFRFYDPRVLKALLESCSANQAAEFFGPISSFLVTKDEKHLTEFQPPQTVARGPGWLVAGPAGRKAMPPEMMAAIARRRCMDFQARLQAHLAERLAEKGVRVPPETLSEQIDIGVLRAPRYDLRRECDVARYVEILCLYAGGFEKRPDPVEVQNFLYDRRVEPAVRLDRLEEWAKSEAGSRYFARQGRGGIRLPWLQPARARQPVFS